MGMSKWADLVDTLDVKCLDSYEFIFSPFHDNLLHGTNNDIIFNLNPKIISLDKQKSYIYDRSLIISFFEIGMNRIVKQLHSSTILRLMEISNWHYKNISIEL